MRCERCGRAINYASFSVTTHASPLVYGPVCAKKMGLKSESIRVRAQYQQPPEVDPRQMKFEFTMETAD